MKENNGARVHQMISRRISGVQESKERRSNVSATAVRYYFIMTWICKVREALSLVLNSIMSVFDM